MCSHAGVLQSTIPKPQPHCFIGLHAHNNSFHYAITKTLYTDRGDGQLDVGVCINMCVSLCVHVDPCEDLK